MAKPDIDWTFADVPQDDVPPGALAPAGPPPGGRRPPRWLRREHTFRWLGLGLGLAAIVAAGYWITVLVGEQRIRTQITAEVVYEDTHALAGDADLALGVWADPSPSADLTEPLTAWRAQRAAELALRLAASLPTNALTPDSSPPAVTHVQAVPDTTNVWVATVVRTYRDPAGRALAFAFPQRYQNLGPGVWQRLPPDTAELANTTFVSGVRLSATLPVADLPWLSDSLFAADAALVQACTDWGVDACGDDKVLLVFSGEPNRLPPVQPSAPGLAAGFGAYPWAFDLAPLVPYASEPLMLPSPHMAGLPVDDAARAAITHSLVVYGLTALANAQAGPTERVVDYYRDALVARAELRLGFSPPPTYTLQARDYQRIPRFWEAIVNGPIPAAVVALPLRLQALQVLDEALAGQPASTDGALLRVLHRRAGLIDWLDVVLGEGYGAHVVADWEAQAEMVFETEGSLSWATFEGLSYTCDRDTFVVRDGAPTRLPIDTPYFNFNLATQALSLDGRYLAVIAYVAPPQQSLLIYDFDTRGVLTVTQALDMSVLGWSRGQGLIYTVRDDSGDDQPTDMDAQYHLWRYDLAAQQARQLVAAAVSPWLIGPNAWLPDRRSLVVNLVYPDTLLPSGAAANAPAVVAADAASLSPRRLMPYGYLSLLAPNGQRVAFAVAQFNGGQLATLSALEVLKLDTGERLELLRPEQLQALDSTLPDVRFLYPVDWSGDSVWLLAAASSADGIGRLYLAAADGSRPPIVLTRNGEAHSVENVIQAGHSADGRYLAYRTTEDQTFTTLQLYLLDLDQVSRTGIAAVQPVALETTGAAWSPTGHKLAISGFDGLRVMDVDTGLTRWVSHNTCLSVNWYSSPQP